MTAYPMTDTPQTSIFCDESGTSGKERCYSIGALSIPSDRVPRFNQVMAELVQTHGVQGEVKWKKVSTSHGLINFGLDCLKNIIRGSTRLSIIVVNKSLYRKWNQGNREEAFYTTYSLLLKSFVKGFSQHFDVVCDDRCDSYPKQDEVVQIVTNNMLAQIGSQADLANLAKRDSREYLGLQVVDFFTGAVNCGHDLHLNPEAQVSPGKLLFLERMARILGWDRVVYDTYPNPAFNIWHFPTEYRRDPETRDVAFDLSVPFVTPDELTQYGRPRNEQAEAVGLLDPPAGAGRAHRRHVRDL